MFKDQKRFVELVDPLLRGDYPVRGLNQAVAVAAMCLQEEATVRPMMTDVVTALRFLVTEETSAQHTIPPSPDRELGDHSLLDKEIVEDRQRAVQEAIEWGARSRNHQSFQHETELQN